jgi:hypothetical protein
MPKVTIIRQGPLAVLQIVNQAAVAAIPPSVLSHAPTVAQACCIWRHARGV